MKIEVLRTVLEEAAQLTASLPDSIQEVAFGKAFDALLEEYGTAMARRGRTTRGPSLGGRRAAASRPRRTGPKLALTRLVESGFFTSGRSLPEIQAHLRNTVGRAYESNELSISLLRLTRDGRLQRDRNLAGQYEYWSEPEMERPGQIKALKQGRGNGRLLTDGREMNR
jgi:hypothetical protein